MVQAIAGLSREAAQVKRFQKSAPWHDISCLVKVIALIIDMMQP